MIIVVLLVKISLLMMVSLDENLNLLKFTRVANMMQIHVYHVYTHSKDGKYRICWRYVANTVFTIFAIGVNLYFHHICYPGKLEQIQLFVQCIVVDVIQ